MNVFLFFYSVTLHCLTLLLAPLAHFSLVVPTKLRRMFIARRLLISRIEMFRKSVPGELWWFHVASAGELEQAIPLIESLRQRLPEAVIFLSFFSSSAENAAKRESERRLMAGKSIPWDYADYLCWDVISSVRRYVHALRPKHFVTLHAELWPVLFQELKRQGIAISVGAVFLPKASRLGWAKKAYYRRLLLPVTHLATVDERTTQYLQQQFPSKDIELVGDPRIDRVLDRATHNQSKRSVQGIEVILASLHEADLLALEDWLAEFGRRRHASRLSIVPHEIEAGFMKTIEARLRHLGLPFSKFSQTSTHTPDEDDKYRDQVMVIDQVGHLAELYSKAQIAFVGGSFARSVHNVLEPAAYGLAIVTGPRIERSCEAVEMRDTGALACVPSPQALKETLDALLANEHYRQNMGERAVRYLTDRRGVGERYGEWLMKARTSHLIDSRDTNPSIETTCSSNIPEIL